MGKQVIAHGFFMPCISRGKRRDPRLMLLVPHEVTEGPMQYLERDGTLKRQRRSLLQWLARLRWWR